MRGRGLVLCALVGAGLLFLSCAGAQPPAITAWRPWYRVLTDSLPAVPAGARISIDVTGGTEPLGGDESLYGADLRRTVEGLLTRRGYAVVADSAEFHAKVVYHTREQQSLDVETTSSTVSGMSSATYATQSRSWLGVAIASAMYSASMSHAATTTATRIQNRGAYVHALSTEIGNRSGRLVWKGESTWRSTNIDGRSGFQTSLQMTLSSLPKSSAAIPAVKTVRASHVENYKRIYCENRWFDCPALPYRIAFTFMSVPAKRPAAWGNTQRDAPTIVAFDHSEAIAAYVDLVQTAENALPWEARTGGIRCGRQFGAV